MEDKLEGVVTQLRAEEDRLTKELAEAEKRPKEIRKELERVRAGLAGLGVKTKGKSRTKKSGNTLSAEEVVELVEVELQSGGPLTEEAIKKRVAARASKDGKSGRGLHLAVKKALKDGRFESSQDGYSLAASG